MNQKDNNSIQFVISSPEYTSIDNNSIYKAKPFSNKSNKNIFNSNVTSVIEEENVSNYSFLDRSPCLSFISHDKLSSYSANSQNIQKIVENNQNNQK